MQDLPSLPLAQLRTQLHTLLAQRFTDQEELQTVCWLLLTHLTGKSRAELLTYETISLSQAQQKTLSSWLECLVVYKMPWAYIARFVPFIDINIAVHPPILIPRPETEEWVAYLIETLTPLKHTSLKILDLCTGSGAIGLALAHALPQALVYAIDNNRTAIKLCTASGKLNGIKNIIPLLGNITKPLPLPSYSFDLIVSNPPYLSPEEWQELDPSIKLWEDRNALIAPEQGIGFIKQVAHISRTLCKPDSILLQHGLPQVYCEIGYKQGDVALTCFVQAGWPLVALRKDAAGHDRLITAGSSHETGTHHAHT
jgi:release factor glutamine methyltransferase